MFHCVYMTHFPHLSWISTSWLLRICYNEYECADIYLGTCFQFFLPAYLGRDSWITWEFCCCFFQELHAVFHSTILHSINSIQGLWFLYILTNMLFSGLLFLTEVHCASKIQLLWILCWLIHMSVSLWLSVSWRLIDLLILLFILVEPCFPVSSNAWLVFAGIWCIETKKHQLF